jgi:hypothetical protein
VQLAPTGANLRTTASHFIPLWTYPTPKLLRVKRNLGVFAARVIRNDPIQFLVGDEFSSPNNLGLLGRFGCGDFRKKPVRRHEPAVGSQTFGSRHHCRARSSSSIRSTFEYRKRALEKIFQTEKRPAVVALSVSGPWPDDTCLGVACHASEPSLVFASGICQAKIQRRRRDKA